ncbi:hypothetical protein AKO1_011894 [Acrasis kona]|uniref:Uncharacterized protein n=1 Tax=Acrasis kona TaxID=1008807 RepID=A0AAW2Z881_9EUKA
MEHGSNLPEKVREYIIGEPYDMMKNTGNIIKFQTDHYKSIITSLLKKLTESREIQSQTEAQLIHYQTEIDSLIRRNSELQDQVNQRCHSRSETVVSPFKRPSSAVPQQFETSFSSSPMRLSPIHQKLDERSRTTPTQQKRPSPILSPKPITQYNENKRKEPYMTPTSIYTSGDHKVEIYDPRDQDSRTLPILKKPTIKPIPKIRPSTPTLLRSMINKSPLKPNRPTTPMSPLLKKQTIIKPNASSPISRRTAQPDGLVNNNILLKRSKQ